MVLELDRTGSELHVPHIRSNILSPRSEPTELQVSRKIRGIFLKNMMRNPKVVGCGRLGFLRQSECGDGSKDKR
jgi:hypothetical protein